MFSSKPPRRLVTAGMDPASSSSNYEDIQSDELEYRPSSEFSGGWSLSASTLIGGSLPAAPSRSRPASTPVLRRHRGSAHHRAFSCEIPEDPLRAALGLESVLEHPNSPRDEDAGSHNTVAHSLLDFSRRQVSSIKSHKSALSTTRPRLTPNPFANLVPETEVTGAVTKIRVYFPHAEQPFGQLLDLTLPLNATVEDAIASALWNYREKRWLPELDSTKARDTEIASWIMLAPGKDGVVNKRVAQTKMKRFKFDRYAIVRSPRSLSEKQEIEMQVARFRLLPPPPLPEKRHTRHTLPLLNSRPKNSDVPASFSKLP
ncbi:hypothetical protein B0H11DRAFT_357414 [Mycena galericulata]|nr:hypothetical protein B0H11DRAFT_357414 [Mycena galericulata]